MQCKVHTLVNITRLCVNRRLGVWVLNEAWKAIDKVTGQDRQTCGSENAGMGLDV